MWPRWFSPLSVAQHMGGFSLKHHEGPRVHFGDVPFHGSEPATLHPRRWITYKVETPILVAQSDHQGSSLCVGESHSLWTMRQPHCTGGAADHHVVWGRSYPDVRVGQVDLPSRDRRDLHRLGKAGFLYREAALSTFNRL